MPEGIKQFGRDMIHLTEGEKLVKYWWLWSALLLAGVAWQVYLTVRKR